MLIPMSTGLVQGVAGGGWDLSTAVYEKAFSVGTNFRPRGLAFKPDGTRMYVASNNGVGIREYSLSTAWDVGSASTVATYSTGGNNRVGIDLSNDGARLLTCSSSVTNDDLIVYSLSTAWDITTASVSSSNSNISGNTNTSGIFVRPGEQAAYIADFSGDAVGQFTCSSNYTASTFSRVASLSGTELDSCCGVSVGNNGSFLYVVSNSTTEFIRQYEMSTPWDVTTSSLINSLDVSASTAGAFDLRFNDDGTKMFFADDAGDRIVQYSLG